MNRKNFEDNLSQKNVLQWKSTSVSLLDVERKNDTYL